MKTADLDYNSKVKPNIDNVILYTCGICNKYHSFSVLIKQKRVRFMVSPTSSLFDEIYVDCSYCGCTSNAKEKYAFDLMRMYFQIHNPEYAKLLTMPNVVRMSKEYFNFIKTLEQSK